MAAQGSGESVRKALTGMSSDASVERRVEELLAALDARATGDESAAAAVEIVQLGRAAVERLARSLLEPGPGRREKVAALLGSLTREPAAWARKELEGLGQSRGLSPMERLWVTTAIQGLQAAASPAPVATRSPERPAGTAGGSLAAAVAVADEQELLAWRDELMGFHLEEQRGIVASVLAERDPAILPLVEMVLSLCEPQLDAQVAEGLAAFSTPAVLPILRELLRRPDAETRRLARRTLAALQKRGVDIRGIFAHAAELADARALATRPDVMGQMIIVIARGREPQKLRYAIFGIDPIERGLAESWGESDLTERELRDQIDEFADTGHLELQPIDLNLAQALVAAAEDYTRRQGRELPAEYAAWQRVIGRPSRSAVLPIVFGPSCTECRKALRASDMERGGRVDGELGICARCAGRVRCCASCNRLVDPMFDDFHLQRGKREREVEFLCAPCARRQQKKRKNDG